MKSVFSLSSILLAVLKIHEANTLDTQFHDFLIELGTQLLYALRMKNKSMWTVHNSFGWWWALRVHTVVHFDMNWCGDNLLIIFNLQNASLDTNCLIKLGIKSSIGNKHFLLNDVIVRPTKIVNNLLKNS